VTVAQALHWFDIDAFFDEVDRVLRPGGVLAFWCYQHFMTDDTRVMTVFRRLLNDVEDYWPPERAVVEAQYPDIRTPFVDLPEAQFAITAEWTSDQLLAYARTWSAAQRCMADRGRDPVATHAAAFRDAWGASPRTVTWPIVFRACRKAET
jgi:spermidine synthase